MGEDTRPDEDLTTKQLILNTAQAQRLLARQFQFRVGDTLATRAEAICAEAGKMLTELAAD